MGRINIDKIIIFKILTKMVGIVTIIVCQHSGRFMLGGFN